MPASDFCYVITLLINAHYTPAAFFFPCRTTRNLLIAAHRISHLERCVCLYCCSAMCITINRNSASLVLACLYHVRPTSVVASMSLVCAGALLFAAHQTHRSSVHPVSCPLTGSVPHFANALLFVTTRQVVRDGSALGNLAFFAGMHVATSMPIATNVQHILCEGARYHNNSDVQTLMASRRHSCLASLYASLANYYSCFRCICRWLYLYVCACHDCRSIIIIDRVSGVWEFHSLVVFLGMVCLHL